MWVALTDNRVSERAKPFGLALVFDGVGYRAYSSVG